MENENVYEYKNGDYIVVKVFENGVNVIGLIRGKDIKFYYIEKFDSGEVLFV